MLTDQGESIKKKSDNFRIHRVGLGKIYLLLSKKKKKKNINNLLLKRSFGEQSPYGIQTSWSFLPSIAVFMLSV